LDLGVATAVLSLVEVAFLGGVFGAALLALRRPASVAT
jgi:hypothetical protein